MRKPKVMEVKNSVNKHFSLDKLTNFIQGYGVFITIFQERGAQAKINIIYKDKPRIYIVPYFAVKL